MRDAADVLDYMNEEHSLQHLDIKPENLLMLAGRVKVADFGLVKDIHDATASLMGGLTPLYAPPEVFDGRPSRRSDQYSLAIVYQEMLTGELPFPGTTAMQLARQHLHARPRLSALPEHDQEIIARALSKSPGDRFANCRRTGRCPAARPQEEAAARVRRTRGVQPPLANGSDGTIPSANPARNVDRTRNCWAPASRKCRRYCGRQRIAGASRMRSDRPGHRPCRRSNWTILPRSSAHLVSGRGPIGRPRAAAIAAAVGGPFRATEDVPALQMLLFDTDTKDLLEVTHHRYGLHQPTCSCPRRCGSRRTTGSAIPVTLLRWLSRRWLYNIPKSLKPRGSDRSADWPGGPRGRRSPSACARDHLRGGDRVAGADDLHIRDGLEFGPNDMRVVLLASISGGTGSGMIADLGYLVRHMLGQMGFRDDDVRAVLTHSTGRSSARDRTGGRQRL